VFHVASEVNGFFEVASLLTCTEFGDGQEIVAKEYGEHGMYVGQIEQAVQGDVTPPPTSKAKRQGIASEENALTTTSCHNDAPNDHARTESGCGVNRGSK
jgi:hypothetical protein